MTLNSNALVQPTDKSGDRWQKAAVLGGLWASVEIIIGSLLHNSRVPFAGSILASSSVMLMVAFYQLWPVRGMIIRAGLIAAVMKSVSPSAVIFGPMIGIFTEAVVMELALRIPGRVPGALIGGVLAVLSAPIKKFIGLIIVFSDDIITVYMNFIGFLSKQAGWEAPSAEMLAVSILLVFLPVGLLAGITGLMIGRRAVKRQFGSLMIDDQVEAKTRFSMPDSYQTSSVWLIAVHALMIPAGLALMSFWRSWFSLIFLLLWLVWLGYKYPRMVKQLSRPVFWIQPVIIFVLMLWLGEDRHGQSSSVIGVRLWLAASMVVRAVWVIGCFAALSTELRHPLVSQFMSRRGWKNFYDSLGLAFAALPLMIASLPPARKLMKNPVTELARVVSYADEWLAVIHQSGEQKTD
ncbi:MAG: hypothetical protein CVU06_06230 [Bacteroidetes bacterium HGW-Bacteroidetes-22]|nr:MAG: hypothetical protein CVU06_06230 [Bacteroidetes bacterium HGW-Bacteroidetes-22]